MASECSPARPFAARLGFGFVLLALGGSCAPTTKTTDAFRDPSYAAGPKTSVVVLASGLPYGRRLALEKRLAAGLAQHGVRAEPSYRFFPGALPANEEMKKALLAAGVDGLLVSRYQRVEERHYYDPGEDLWGGYGTLGMVTDEPGYVTDRSFFFVTSLWDTSSGKLLFTARTETESPSTGKSFAASIAKVILPRLEQAGLIPPVRAPVAAR